MFVMKFDDSHLTTFECINIRKFKKTNVNGKELYPIMGYDKRIRVFDKFWIDESGNIYELDLGTKELHKVTNYVTTINIDEFEYMCKNINSANIDLIVYIKNYLDGKIFSNEPFKVIVRMVDNSMIYFNIYLHDEKIKQIPYILGTNNVCCYIEVVKEMIYNIIEDINKKIKEIELTYGVSWHPY